MVVLATLLGSFLALIPANADRWVGEGAAKSVAFVGSLGGNVWAVAVDNDTAYIGEGSRLVVLDVSDPSDQLPLAELQLRGEVRDVVVAGTQVYVANREHGLQIVEVSDPADPLLSGGYPIPAEPTA